MFPPRFFTILGAVVKFKKRGLLVYLLEVKKKFSMELYEWVISKPTLSSSFPTCYNVCNTQAEANEDLTVFKVIGHFEALCLLSNEF